MMKSSYCAAALAVVFLVCAVGCDAAKKVEFLKGDD